MSVPSLSLLQHQPSLPRVNIKPGLTCGVRAVQSLERVQGRAMRLVQGLEHKCCLKPNRGITLQAMACAAQRAPISVFAHAINHGTERIYWVPGTQTHNKNILLYFFKTKPQAVVMHQSPQLLKTDLEKLINTALSWLH